MMRVGILAQKLTTTRLPKANVQTINRPTFSKLFVQKRDIQTLEPLPFEWRDGLNPAFTARSLEQHYKGHVGRCVQRANAILETIPVLSGMELDQLMVKTANDTTYRALFNYVGSIWNHQFFFRCVSPRKTQLTTEAAGIISMQFNGVENFKKKLFRIARGVFGSGWVWVVADGTSLEIMVTYGSENPLTTKSGKVPILCLDMWEHAYVVDHGHRIDEYLEAWWQVINWDFVSKNVLDAMKLAKERANAEEI